jgi:hypothetical protein
VTTPARKRRTEVPQKGQHPLTGTREGFTYILTSTAGVAVVLAGVLVAIMTIRRRKVDAVVAALCISPLNRPLTSPHQFPSPAEFQ